MLLTMFEEPLDSVLHQLLHNTQSGIISVQSSIVKHVILNLIREEVIRDSVQSPIAKLFDSDGAPDEL